MDLGRSHLYRHAAPGGGPARIVRAQAAVGAILVTVVGHPEQGFDRVVDAIIGAGVALAFSQLLFPPEPLRLLRRAETTVLSSLAAGLQTTATHWSMVTGSARWPPLQDAGPARRSDGAQHDPQCQRPNRPARVHLAGGAPTWSWPNANGRIIWIFSSVAASCYPDGHRG